MKEHLNLTELNSAKDLSLPPGPFGFVLEQEKLSNQLVHWQNIRKKMIKDLFLATLEKVRSTVQYGLFGHEFFPRHFP